VLFATPETVIGVPAGNWKTCVAVMVTVSAMRCAPLLATICSVGAGNCVLGIVCVYVNVVGLGTVWTVKTPLKDGSVRKKPCWIGFGVVGAGTEPTVTFSPGNNPCGTVVVIVTAPVTFGVPSVFTRLAPLGLAMSALPPADNSGGRMSETTADAVAGPLFVTVTVY